MADATAAVPYSNNIGLYLIPVCILGFIALGLVVLRIYTRLTRVGKLYPDDWLIVFAETISCVNICLAGAAAAYGWGKPIAYLTPSQLVTSLKLQFATQTTWIFSLCAVRLSVAASLLRFGTEKSWRWPLYGLMTLQALISSSYVVLQFAQCRPVSSNWESVPDVECWDLKAIVNYGWAIAGVYVAMDLTLSLMPIRLIRTLSRSTSEKMLIGVLMALGLLATGIACAKMTTFNSFGGGDPGQATVKPSMWAKLEEVVGIIASSLPCLKAPAQDLLSKLGILKEHQLTRPSFVNTVPLPDRPKDQRSSSEFDFAFPSGKGDVRVDSTSVLKLSSGSSGSKTNRKGSVGKQPWDAV